MTSANVDAASVPTMSFARPIIYGNVAYALKKPENEHTHRWTVYVKAFDDGEDISLYVKKVIFKLHDSFQQPNRGNNRLNVLPSSDDIFSMSSGR